MPKTKVILYQEEDGSVPLMEWLDKLTQRAQVKCLARIERLAGEGNALRRPEADYLREQAELTQAQVAKLIGTSRTVISRLEDADYEGHSLSMLRRVAAALNRRVEIRFVKVNKELQPA
jgi:DNA-binding XRE family transcriptional regulator